MLSLTCINTSLKAQFNFEKQLNKFKEGSTTLDQMTKKYLRTNLEYQYLVVDNFQDAIDLDGHCKRGAIFEQKPLFNPIDQEN